VSRARSAIALGLLLLAAGATAAVAHVGGSTGYATITVSRNTVRYALTLPTAALPSELAEALRLAQTGSAQNRDKLLDLLRRHVVLSSNGTRCEPGPGEVTPSAVDAPSFAMQLDFACAGAVQDLVVRDNIFDALGPDHHTLAKVEADGETRELAFAPESREARVSVGRRDAGREEGSFFKLGVEHILTGYDHLLFLGALLLRGGRLLSLFKIITAFTVAHSITLALAVLGVVTVPERLVESVIAASIVYVALENIFLRDAPSQRWLVSFLFGLVHGFGFASALSPLRLPARHLALALLSFNLGVEAGQALVVAVLLPVLIWMRGARWERRTVQTASGAVALMGFIWFMERVAGG
jgi:hydrogenase/urease accessory protein HupE